LKSREKTETASPDANAKILSLILLAASFVFYANFSERYHPALSVAAISQTSVKVADAVNIFENGLPSLKSAGRRAGTAFENMENQF